MAHAAARLAAAVTLGVVALAGCSTQPETIRTYTPANGANVDQGDVKARALAIVADGEHGLLSGSIVAGKADDKLVDVAARAVGADGQPGSTLIVTGNEVPLPAGRMVQLPEHQVGVDGKLVPGLTAQVTLTFEKAGTAQVSVPVVSAKDPDWATMTPKPGSAATSSSSASPTDSPTPGLPEQTGATPGPESPTASPSR